MMYLMCVASILPKCHMCICMLNMSEFVHIHTHMYLYMHRINPTDTHTHTVRMRRSRSQIYRLHQCISGRHRVFNEYLYRLDITIAEGEETSQLGC